MLTSPPSFANIQAANIEPDEANLLPTEDTITDPTVPVLPAFSPAHTSDKVIDYASSDGMNLYNSSIAILPIKDFKGTKGNIQTRIDGLMKLAQAMSWTTILTVVSNKISYFIPRYLTLTNQQVQEHARSCLFTHQGHPKENSVILYHCLYASIGPKIRKKSVTTVLTT
jgi:hypothetical protein